MALFTVFLLHHQYQKSVPSAGSIVLDLKKYLKCIKKITLKTRRKLWYRILHIYYQGWLHTQSLCHNYYVWATSKTILITHLEHFSLTLDFSLSLVKFKLQRKWVQCNKFIHRQWNNRSGLDRRQHKSPGWEVGSHWYSHWLPKAILLWTELLCTFKVP